MKFKSNPVEIEAWRWDCGELAPDWLALAEKDDRVRFGNLQLKFGVTYSRGNVILFKEGDWLIYNGPDDIYPCDQETFNQRYERTKE